MLENDNDVRLELLNGLVKTRSWVNIEATRGFLSEEEYQMLFQKLNGDVEMTAIEAGTAKNFSKEKLNQITHGIVQKTNFVVEKNSEDKFVLKDILPKEGDEGIDINPSQINTINLATTVFKAMRKHSDYGVFHDSLTMTGNEIKETLEKYMNFAASYWEMKADKYFKLLHPNFESLTPGERINLMEDKDIIENHLADIDVSYNELLASGEIPHDDIMPIIMQEYVVDKRLNLPYYQVAKSALMKWNGLSEEEANKIINYSTEEKIEEMVDAKKSINYAIQRISEVLDIDKEELSIAVYKTRRSPIADYIFKPAFTEKGIEPNELILDTLFAVHDGWVKDKSEKFMARDKKHQHMPSELIGWEEVKADLVFVKPIFEYMGIKVDEKELETVYNESVKNFFLDRNIKTKEDLSKEILKGEEFYPALSGQTANISFLQNKEQVDNIVIPQIESKGIGKVESVRENILGQIKDNPKIDDLVRLSPEEIEIIETGITKEVGVIKSELEDLRQKNSIVRRIIGKAKERTALMKVWAIEKGKQVINNKDSHD